MVEHYPFKLNSEFDPQGPTTRIEKIVKGVEGKRHQTLLGATRQVRHLQ